MKVNATAHGRRICDTVGKMLSEYDRPVIVLRFHDNGSVEASVCVEGAPEIITLNHEDVNITRAIRGLDAEVKARVTSMAESADIDLALPDEDT